MIVFNATKIGKIDLIYKKITTFFSNTILCGFLSNHLPMLMKFNRWLFPINLCKYQALCLQIFA